MLIINIFNPPVNKFLKDFSCLFWEYVKAVNAWAKANGHEYIGHGKYRRKTPAQVAAFWIYRVRSRQDGKTHALLPCFVNPYSRVLIHLKEAAIRNICFNEATIEVLAEFCRVSPSTIQRWWQRWKARTGKLLEWLAEELASSNRPTDWLGGNYHSDRARGRKVFTLLELYRDTFEPDFLHCDFALLNVINHSFFLR